MIWKLNAFIFLGLSLCLGSSAQTLDKPQVVIDSILFVDSAKVSVNAVHPSAKVLMEIGKGNNRIFREISEDFYVKNTQSLSFKCSHPDFEDSETVTIKVYKKSALPIELAKASELLTDGVKGSLSLDEEQWETYTLDLLEFKFYTQAKKLEEVELLSVVKPKEHILPPKKVSLYAHLRNGQKVHIRTANTVGKFNDDEIFWSHSVRLIGKPKLKKILRKTEYFSLTVIPHMKDGVPQTLYFDEVLVR